MKLVLDYIYGGAMYLCGAHMQYVIQVGTDQEVKSSVCCEYFILDLSLRYNWFLLDVDCTCGTVYLKSNFFFLIFQVKTYRWRS